MLMDLRPLTLRELRLLQAAEAVVSSWELYRLEIASDSVLRLGGEDIICALERLDDALDPYHWLSDGGE
jgi:hypothetical protein